MLRSIRARITFWYVSVFGLLLLGFSAFIYLTLAKSLYSKLDESLANDAQIAAASFETETLENGGDIAAGAAESLSELQLRDVYVAMYAGERLLATNYPEDSLPKATAGIQFEPENSPGIRFATNKQFGPAGGRLCMITAKAGPSSRVLIATSLAGLKTELGSLRRVFFIGYPAALFIGGLGGLLLARQSLAPVVAMSDQAQRISAGNLHKRLSVDNPDDELGRLAATFNDLLSRLDRSFHSMRAFIADASHEFRTPLSIIRGEAELTLSQERDPAEYREALSIVHDEALRLSAMVDDLLALARADSGQQTLETEEFYINELLEECCRSASVLAVKRGVALTMTPQSDVQVRADLAMLRRMILNLLDNALKYTQPGGSVCADMIADDSEVRISVTDTGIGIPAEFTSRVFERFYRVSRSRTRAEGGSGLGLAIAKWVAEAHGGTISVTSTPGLGSSFVVILPRDGEMGR